MKPGSLVAIDHYDPITLGVIVHKSNTDDVLNDKLYRWWEVLCNNKIVVKCESDLKLVE